MYLGAATPGRLKPGAVTMTIVIAASALSLFFIGSPAVKILISNSQNGKHA
jgi:hypothetical protein